MGVLLPFPKYLYDIDNSSRVLSLSFTYSVSSKYIICGGEDGRVKLWNLENKECISQHKTHKSEVLAVISSSINEYNFYSGDSDGKIVKWIYSETDPIIVSYSPIPSGDCIFCIEISPLTENVIVVGYRSGCLLVIDIEDKKIIHRLTGHTQEVQGLSWFCYRGIYPYCDDRIIF